MKKNKKALRVREIYENSITAERTQWEYINQKGFDFANDVQITKEEKKLLEEQGMPTFTINRITPVVEMLNFYATSNTPRWQAVGAEGSDADVAAIFSDLADYIWHNSKGSTLFANAVNDSITKSVGYILVTVDPDQDQGMGEVIIQQPDPFDIFVDHKSRDLLFRDAAYVLIRKILPKSHLEKMYPAKKNLIKKASSNLANHLSYSEKPYDSDQQLFHYKDITDLGIDNQTSEEFIEFYELYEKIKVPHMNVFYREMPNEEQIKQIQEQVAVKMQEMAAEMEVQLAEQQSQMSKAVESGEMLPQRYELEMEKAQKMMQQQLQVAEQEYMSQLQSQMSKVENVILTEKEYNILLEEEDFAKKVIEAVKFYDSRIQLCCVIGDQLLYEKVLPIRDYPLIPIHYKWTGTPFSMSAVSPLIGKQRELNKAHQLMVHNASLGSSLRWMYEEGAIDTDYWEKYSSAPGALLPKRPGFEPPTPVLPFQLNNAFFGIVQNGKSDMEYLAGIYSAMQGDTSAQHETFRGMLALDEYGTRRIKQWLKNSIEPALQQIGEIVKEYSQAVYTAHKTFRIVQPSALQEEREQEMNIPMYNDYGEAIGKFKDYASAKFDVRIIAGSTLPVNRWAYLEELKQLLQLGVVDDLAVLAETDIRNKSKIAERKSLYAQLQGQIGQMEESLKDKDGTIETLERQLVQAGIKGKIQDAEMEIQKEKEEAKSEIKGETLQTEAEQKTLRNVLDNNVSTAKQRMDMIIKDLQKTKKSE